MANLFTSQTPAITNASDGTPGITFATTLVFAVDGTVTGVRFYATTSVSGTYTGGIWSVDSSDPGTGTLLASKTLAGSPAGGAWNTITFTDGEGNPTPVSVTTGVAYRVGVFSGDGRYVATTNFFPGGGGGLTNGDIFAPPNNDNPVGSIVIGQGTFTISAAFSYPTTSGSGTCYFADVEFTAAGEDPVSPNGLAVSVGLGQPTVNAGLTVAPNGLSVATALGSPSVNAGLTVAPNGLSVATALGSPSVGLAGSAPGGLSVPVGLGNPTVVTAYTVVPDGLGVPVSLGSPSIVRSAAPDGLAIPISLGAPTVGQAAGSSGWHDFGGIIQGAINDTRINAERRRNPIDCPEHGWPLEITPRGRHCKFGGHVVTGSW